MKIQKLTALALALALLFALAACGALTGPTAMGMAKIFSDADAGTAANDYEYALYGAADELTPQLLQGGVDIAAVPLNLASVLYNKTSGGVKLCAVGVLGVLYITEFNGETVQSLADLKGKTVYATGKGSTPEYFLRYLLAENGLDLDTDVTVEWKSEPSEVVALLKAENVGIAMLPQPYVTAAAAQLGEGFRAAVSLSEAWDALDNGSRCVTAGVVVRTELPKPTPRRSRRSSRRWRRASIGSTPIPRMPARSAARSTSSRRPSRRKPSRTAIWCV